MIRYQLTLTLVEDLHTGTGFGSGVIDSILLRDKKGWPYLKRSHVKGVWREVAREGGKLGKWKPSDVDKLFGGRGPSARSAMSNTSFRCSKKPTTLNWSSSARVLNGRSPKEDLLRVEEFLAAGTVLSGTVELYDVKLEKMLLTCFSMADTFGASRTRGSGEVKAEWRILTPPPNVRPVLLDSAANCGPAPSLRLILKNLEAACLPATALPGNIIPSESFVRGQVLAGAFVGMGLRNGLRNLPIPSVADALPGPDGASVTDLLAGTVIPTPLALRRAKAAPQREAIWPWWAPGQTQADVVSTDSAVKRPPDREYVYVGASTRQHFEPSMSLTMRNDAGEWQDLKEAAREKRAREGSHTEEPRQSLFSQEEIAEDTLFSTCLSFGSVKEAVNFEKEIGPLLAKGAWLLVGRGGAPFQVVSGKWSATTKKEFTPGASELNVVLTSDTIIRDLYLNFHTTLSVQSIADALSAEIQGLKQEYQSISDSEIIAGFNPVSGLPRTTEIAIRRGSCLTLSGPAEEIEKLRQKLLACPSLGERTHEGFGRFLVDFDLSKKGETNSAEKPFEVSHGDEIYALAASLELKASGPSASQWMDFVNLVRDAKTEQMLDLNIAKLKEHSERKSGKAWKPILEILAAAIRDLHGHEDRLLFARLVAKRAIQLARTPADTGAEAE